MLPDIATKMMCRLADLTDTFMRSLIWQPAYARTKEERCDDRRKTKTLKPGVLSGSKLRAFDTVIQSKLAELLPPVPPANPSAWLAVISRKRVEALLAKDVVSSYVEVYGGIHAALYRKEC